MPFTQKKILDFIRSEISHPLKMKELAKAFSVSKREYPEFRKVVKELIFSGELVKLNRGRIGLVSEMDIIVGEISVNRNGIGFVPTQNEEEQDIMIPTTGMFTAMDGDKVMVRLGGFTSGRKTGTVIKVIDRADRNLVGIFHIGKAFNYVSPDNQKIHRDLYIPPKESNNAKDGEKVVVVLTCWDDPHLNPEGKITERLGYPHQKGVDMLTILKSYNLLNEFPEDVINFAEKVAKFPDKEQLADRVDLTKEMIYTIDPSDAKDHDDAISVEEITGGFRLGVHIADVSYYVQEKSILDKEALKRGNSVYLPGMVIPMLPEILSNDICSLKVNRRRLAHSINIFFDKKGNMLRWEIFDSIINSKAKLSYEDVQDFFDGKESPPKIKRVEENLIAARKLSQLLTKRRFSEGSLDFDLPESKIVMNKQGEVIELGHRIRLESHRLVEEFMLVANRAVAKEVSRLGQPLLYRVHGRPDMEKLEAFSIMMKRLGYRFPVSPEMKPIQFSRFLEKIKGVPEVDLINELMLRSMQKAVYQRKNIGHFGLAFNNYAHFTSPIRRYPDLLVHRLLRSLKNGKYPHAIGKDIKGIIDHIGTHCSETERKAEQAERQAIKVKQVGFMAQHVGDEFPGVISGVLGYGFFVKLDKLGAEGMVRISLLDDDYYHFDEKLYRFVGRRTEKIYRLGDKIKVIIVSVDKLKSEINLMPVIEKKAVKKKFVNKNFPRRKRRKR